MLHLIHKVPRNAALLLGLLLMIVALPSLPTETPGFVVELLFDWILLSGVYSAGTGQHRRPFVLLTVTTLAVRWAAILSGAPSLDVSALFISAVWLVGALAIIIASAFRRRDVSVDMIVGAMVTYLLAAAAFNLTYQIIEIQDPGSFSGMPEGAAQNPRQLASIMMYFSLVCITTIGFGDIMPVSNIARPLAALEGVFGQLYLAVMIARLVGLHVAHEERKQG
ncbi:MAG: potassium channel family protein [Polyangiales bacterium]